MTTGEIHAGGGTLAFQYDRKWSGANDPKKRRFNAYSADIYRRETTESRRANPVYPYIPAYWSTYNQSSPWSTNNIDEGQAGDAILKCRSKLAEAIRGHDFNAGVFIAESLEALEQIVKSMNAAFAFLHAVATLDLEAMLRSLARIPGQTPAIARRNLRRKGLRDPGDRRPVRPGEVSSVWLAMQYGWLPLIADLMEAIKAYEALHAEPRSLTFTASAKSAKRVEECSIDPTSYKAPGTRQTVCRLKIRVKEKISVTRLLGLHNMNPAAWERIPFSFVVDWFIPIGAWIESWSFFQGLEFEWEQSIFQTILYDYPCTPTPPPNNTGWFLLGRVKGKHAYVRRTSGSGSGGGPSWGIPLPSVKSMERIFSKGHIQNAVALIDQLIRSRGKPLPPKVKPRLGGFAT